MPKKPETFNWDIVYKAVGWILISGLVLLLLAFVVGGPFRPILKFVGLEIPGFGGVFINCDDPKNARADFCRPNEDRIRDRNQKSDSNSGPGTLPFNLNN